MKEISQIHIASFPYHIAVDAKRELEHYLQAIEKSLAADEEAMREIESRMAELLSERGVTKDKVIVLRDIEALKEQLGEARDFTDETALQQKVSDGPEKKLMRDSQGAMFGGVAQGMATYFSVEVVWVRLLWAVFAVATAGFGVLVYGLLWVLTPRAKTATDRLVMAGKPVTLEALKQSSGEAEADHEPAPLAFLRKIVGMALSILAFVPVVFVAVTLYRVFSPLEDGSTMTPPALVVVGMVLLAISGLLAGVFIGQIARLVIVRHAQKRQVAMLSVTVALGLVLAVGGVGSLILGSYQGDLSSQPVVTQKLAAPEGFDSVKQLRATTNELVTLKYIVSDSDYRVEVKLRSATTSAKDNAKLVIKDGVLDVVYLRENKACSAVYGACHVSDELWVYGPELESIEVLKGQVYYESRGKQPSLSAIVHSSAYLDTGHSELGTLKATVQGNGVVQADQTTVRDVELELASVAFVGIGSVVSVNVTAPVACPATPSKAVLSMVNAQELTVNGQKTAVSTTHACLDVNVIDLTSGMPQE